MSAEANLDLDILLRDEIVEEQVQFLKDMFNNFERYANLKCVEFCKITATHIMESYLIDVARYDYFHIVNESIDNQKHGAFLMKWIARMRPLYLTTSDTSRLSDINYMVNSVFAYYVGCFAAGVKVESVEPELSHLLMYSLEYRSVLDSLTLIPQLVMLQKLHPDLE